MNVYIFTNQYFLRFCCTGSFFSCATLSISDVHIKVNETIKPRINNSRGELTFNFTVRLAVSEGLKRMPLPCNAALQLINF